ncbi:hypothetical protein AVDCRST_MAG84-2262 [uncultured Microcoleus sp.]|uniref:Uncharacterized protein n=1 Tax=uncultured Microcoleus sp. TaxID=259945 RepID=A0A6J4LR35_9CYAN|nr:hypothetical protein AVDCRST_MAG84-2262 [uncultured Microcoleus sp.]
MLDNWGFLWLSPAEVGHHQSTSLNRETRGIFKGFSAAFKSLSRILQHRGQVTTFLRNCAPENRVLRERVRYQTGRVSEPECV